jgi:hypothetical protein
MAEGSGTSLHGAIAKCQRDYCVSNVEQTNDLSHCRRFGVAHARLTHAASVRRNPVNPHCDNAVHCRRGFARWVLMDIDEALAIIKNNLKQWQRDGVRTVNVMQLCEAVQYLNNEIVVIVDAKLKTLRQ